MLVRPAQPSDIAALAHLEAALFTREAWSSTIFQQILSQEHTLSLVALESDMPADGVSVPADGSACPQPLVGYCLLNATKPDAELLVLAVAEQASSRGLGTSLLSQGLELCRARGCVNVFLEVRKSNVRARRVYEKLGFEEIGERKNYYSEPKENALVMKKRLTAPSPGPVGNEFSKADC